ncbi:hypothetical protein DEH81_01945 [Pectobacterium zantedeschiae]|nr:hypothetical protein DEH81_01945 [Pectobacterium zantedeschiae]
MPCLQIRNMKWNLIVIKKKRGFIYIDHVAGIFLSGKKAERDGAHIMAPDLSLVPYTRNTSSSMCVVQHVIVLS